MSDDRDLAALPNLPAFANRVAVARWPRERVGDVSAELFDLTTEESDGDSGTKRVTRTFVLVPASDLPTFELEPLRLSGRFVSWFGAEGVRFDSRAAPANERETVRRFQATYRLNAVSILTMMSGQVAPENDDAVRRVFSLGVLAALLRRGDWRVQCEQGHIAFWVSSAPLEKADRAELLADAVAILALFRSAPGPVLPAPPGTLSPARQAARFQAAALGAVFGTFAGFFVAGTWNAMDFFARPHGERMAMSTDSARFILFIVLGAIGGGLLGRLLPLKQPLLRKPNDPRREKVVGCAVLFGLFGGFFGGAITGAILGELLGLKIDDSSQRAALTFGGIGCGALLGPIVAGVATNFIYLGLARFWSRK